MLTSISRLISPKKILILIGIFFLLTRLYKISEIPPSVYWDEASIGYNAYSIARTGEDEWGSFLPTHFRAFGEFKLPVYIYTVVPFVKIFGLNEISIRLPAVLFSLISVFLIYLIVLRIFKSSRAALFSSLFFSISSWFFIFSRTGYEATAGLMFFLLGFYSYLYAREKKIALVLSTLSLILSIYSYNSFRFVSPLVLIIFLFLHLRWNSGRKNLILIFCSIIIFLLSLLPIIKLSLFDAGFVRTQSFRLFPTIQQVYDLSGKPHFQLIYDRTGAVSWRDNVLQFFKNYFIHFHPEFLFLNGDSNPRSQQSGFGQIYFLDIALFLLGLAYLKRYKNKWNLLLIFLFILSPVPAALFKESPHALRSLLMAVMIAIITGLGMEYIVVKKKSLVLFIMVIYFFFFTQYFRAFIVDYSNIASEDWQFGYKEIFTKYANEFKNYDRVIISDQYAQPYIFALYYLKYDPEKFKMEVKYNPVNDWGFSTVRSFDKFEFKKIDITESNSFQKRLIFVTDLEKFNNINPTSEIKFLDGKTAFWVYQL